MLSSLHNIYVYIKISVVKTGLRGYSEKILKREKAETGGAVRLFQEKGKRRCWRIKFPKLGGARPEGWAMEKRCPAGNKSR